MKRCFSSLLLLALLAGPVPAAPVPPAERLLPSDTLGVIAVGDMTKLRAASAQWASTRLWQDPALRPFREKFLAKFKTEITEPLEKALGLKFADYAGLAQGQLTLAILPGADTAEAGPGLLLLLDTREKSDTLKARLAEVKTKWVDAGQALKTEKIRDLEFATLVFSAQDLNKLLSKVFPGGPPWGRGPQGAERKFELLIGQSDSLLLVGNSAKAIEKVLARQAGGALAPLAEHADFARCRDAQFRDALVYGWLDLKTILEAALKRLPQPEEDGNAPQAGQMLPRMDRVLSALGLTGIRSLTFGLREDAEGSLVRLHINVPEPARKGLFKILAFEARDSAPPPFVPADAVEFSRLRLDLPKAWQALENALVEAMPQAAGVIKLLVDNAGKDKDPNFDLRKNLIANLGDDIISYEKLPRQPTLQDLDSPPSLLLLSSPRAEQLASALRALSSMFPQRSSKLKEREFLGRTVYSMSFALPGMGGNAPADRTLHYAASGGHVALSYDMAMLEEYLRASGTAPKPLRETAGLAQAAQKVGGLSTGLFGYQNTLASTRFTWEILRKESGSLATLFSGNPVAARFGLNDEARLRQWFDFSLLPPFDQVAQYFHFSVFAGSVNPDGLALSFFIPVPPRMKK